MHLAIDVFTFLASPRFVFEKRPKEKNEINLEKESK